MKIDRLYRFNGPAQAQDRGQVSIIDTQEYNYLILNNQKF